jgi:hypothetical protein
MTSRIEREFRPISVVDGLELFEQDLRMPSKETGQDEADGPEPVVMKKYGGKDRQKHKK